MNKQKEWYKNPWGVVVAILLLPFFIIWYAWAKSKWSKGIKIGATVGAVLIIIIALASSSPKTEQNTQQTAQNNTTETKQAEQPKVEEPKKDNSELKADIKRAYDVPGIEVTNLETVAWNDCEIKLNGDYERTIRNPLNPNEPLNNPYPLFTKGDGTKFNPDTTAVKDVAINCKIDGTTRYGFYTF